MRHFRKGETGFIGRIDGDRARHTAQRVPPPPEPIKPQQVKRPPASAGAEGQLLANAQAFFSRRT